MSGKRRTRPTFSTVVDPSEYDVDGQMEDMVRKANKNRECFSPMDVGKVYGLYLAWRELRDRVDGAVV